MTSQLHKNDIWKLTSTGTKIRDYVDEITVLTFFSAFPLARKINRKKQTTFYNHPALDFALTSQFTSNVELQKLSHDQHSQGNTRNKMNAREFKNSLHLNLDSSLKMTL